MTAMTVSDILLRVQRTFGDEANIQVTEADVIRWINDAQREVVMQHEGLLSAEAFVASVVGQPEYSLPADCFTVQHMFFSIDGDKYYPMTFLPVAELNDNVPGWINTSTQGIPVVYTKASTTSKFRVYPVPHIALATAIKIIYSRYPTTVTTSASPIDLPDYYHSYVEHFCMMKAYEKDEDWDAVDRKASLAQNTINENLYREAWFGRETYPTVVDKDYE